ncbi:MAG: thioesterase II family protein, partial [Halothece sp.]
LDRAQSLPKHLFVSGRRAPQIPEDDPPSYNLPDAELIKKLRWLNGTSAKILDDPEMMQLMLPILRADFAVCETYEYQSATPLPCPITAFGGWRDPAIRHGGLKGWREQTTNNFTKKTFPGNHFFLHSAEASLLKFLQKQLIN